MYGFGDLKLVGDILNCPVDCWEACAGYILIHKLPMFFEAAFSGTYRLVEMFV